MYNIYLYISYSFIHNIKYIYQYHNRYIYRPAQCCKTRNFTESTKRKRHQKKVTKSIQLVASFSLSSIPASRRTSESVTSTLVRHRLVSRSLGVVEEEGGVSIPEVLDSDEVVPGELGANEGVHLLQVAQQPEQPARQRADHQHCLDHTFIRSFPKDKRKHYPYNCP